MFWVFFNKFKVLFIVEVNGWIFVGNDGVFFNWVVCFGFIYKVLVFLMINKCVFWLVKILIKCWVDFGKFCILGNFKVLINILNVWIFFVVNW